MLDKQLRNLSKINPSKGFITESKSRLMQQIKVQQNESWLQSALKRIGLVSPSKAFASQARMRLMTRIANLPSRLTGFARTLQLLKRGFASAMIMIIAVTSTLFIVEGNAVVEASDDSYLEIISGKASIKHADLIVWDDINSQIEIQAGDLIKVAEGSEVVIHFFDDTQIRLGENSLFLINQLAVSPAFGRQGIIEVALHEGKAWAQTLNVDDGYAGLTLSTRDAIAKTLNGTFSVETRLEERTTIMAHSNKLELDIIQPETRQSIEHLKLPADQKAIISIANHPTAILSDISQQDLSSEWIQANLKRDHQHLASLRKTGFEHLTQVAGTLPGDMLYPIKQAKERLKLALSSDSELSVLVEIANSRLNEAMVLFENGEKEKGREALLIYQSTARKIAELNGNKFASQLIVPHQKILTANLANNASVGLVKETLQQTAEIFTNSPIDLERVKLKNSMARVEDISNLIGAGELDAARDRLTSHQLATSDILAAIESIEDVEAKKGLIKEVLELRREEFALLETLSNRSVEWGNDNQLAAILESARNTAEENVEDIIAFATPIAPELVITEEISQPSRLDTKIAELIKRINIYETWQGQRNQIDRLLKHEFENVSSIDYLIAVRNAMEGRTVDYINTKILQLEGKALFQKHKAMQKKIERSKRLREV